MKATINNFIEDKHIAIAGVSRDDRKWGNGLMKELEKLGYTIYPINPNTDEIKGKKCYRNISDLPEDIKSLIIATKPKDTLELVKQVKNSNIKQVWMQRGAGKGSASPEAIEYCKENGINYVYGFCPMMFFGTGMHKFHFWMRKNFGKMPEEFKD